MVAAAELPLPTSAPVLGCESPRLATEPLRPLTPETSLGFEAIEFIEVMCDVTLLPWQKWWLIHALELLPNDRFRFRTILTLVGRQNGKTTLLKCLAIYFMFMNLAEVVLGVAQSLDISKESWQGAVDIAQSNPELSAEVKNVRYANGEQCLTLVNGSRYRIAAANRRAGRGLSVDLLVMDELREQRDWLAWSALSKTTIARANGLTVAISNAGDDESVVLNHLRESALAGQDETLGIFEWSAPDGCDLDDMSAIAQANPGLGMTITEQAIRSALATDPPGTFRTEVLCQRVDTLADVAVSQDAWNACLDKSMKMNSYRDSRVFCLDISPDTLHASLAGAAIGEDGRIRVGVVKSWRGTEATNQLRDELPDLLRSLGAKTLAWYPSGPAAALKADLEALRAQSIDAANAAAACQGFADLANSRRLVHAGEPVLTNHVLGAKRFRVGDGWRFVRRGVGHVDAAYAAAGAVHLVRKPKPKTRFVGWA